MADKDPSNDGPSLELPTFGFGRKKKAARAEPAHTPDELTAPTPAPEPPPLAPELDPIIPDPEPARVASRPVTTKVEPAAEPAAEPEPEAAPPRPKREFTLPVIAAPQAALVVGALIGLLAVMLTFGSLKLCELGRGTDSCGGGPGLLLLLATLVILTYVGSMLLRGFGIADPGSTSLLAVGLLAVMTMVFFLDVIYNWWMVIAIPLVAMAAYALSWWVTTRSVDID